MTALAHVFELDAPALVKSVRLEFPKTFDFYGRVTVYRLRMAGQKG